MRRVAMIPGVVTCPRIFRPYMRWLRAQEALIKQRGKQEPLDGTDPMLVTMKKYGITLTRRNYLEMCYPDGFPDPWTA